MYGEMLLTLIFLAIIMAIYLNNRKKMIAENNKTMTYDLIIKFNNDNYVDIRKIKYFKDIAGWVRYGEYGFRGNSVLNKDLLETITHTVSESGTNTQKGTNEQTGTSEQTGENKSTATNEITSSESA